MSLSTPTQPVHPTQRIIVGDVRAALATLPDKSVHCCVTSPPYYGLRSYGTPSQVWDGDLLCEHEWGSAGRNGQRQRNGAPGGLHDGRATNKLEANVTLNPEVGGFCVNCNAWLGHLGLEPTLALYLEHMVAVFREMRRVMRDDATLWLNIGDSYNAYNGNRGSSPSLSGGQVDRPTLPTGAGLGEKSLKPKDLMMVPSRLAIALQDDGWWIRSDIIWHKRAPMPESVTDRPTSAHEHIFLLTKSPRYFYDATAVAETSDPAQAAHNAKYAKTYAAYDDRAGASGQPGNVNNVGIHSRPGDGTRNLRNVWTLSPEPFLGAHFATMPTEIPRRAIKAGTSERGCCAVCGAGWRRITEKTTEMLSGSGKAGNLPSGKNGSSVNGGNVNLRMGPTVATFTLDWEPSCNCGVADTVPAVVLDPFLGSGTSLLVADSIGRSGIGIELNPTYAVDIAEKRITGDAPLMARVTVEHLSADFPGRLCATPHEGNE